MGVGAECQPPADLTPDEGSGGKSGWAPRTVRTGGDKLTQPGLEPRNVQPVEDLYPRPTDIANYAPELTFWRRNYFFYFSTPSI